MKASDVEAGWLAGLIEGEASISRHVDRRTGYVSWELSVSSVDEDVIRRAHQIAGVGVVYFVPRQRAHWQDQWRWLVAKRDDIALTLATVLPLLGRRRSARAMEFAAWWISCKPLGSGKSSTWTWWALTQGASREPF